MGEAGRQKRVSELEERLLVLCRPYWNICGPESKPHERDFGNLINELTERLMDEELFTFVLDPDVEATNNVSERTLRDPAEDRKVGRTSKSPAGAHRRSVITSVLESLRLNLPLFTFQSVLEEVQSWIESGISLFQRQWQALQRALALDTS